MGVDKQNYITILALGTNELYLASNLSEILLNCGCNIINFKMNHLGEEFCCMGFISGTWGAIAKLEALIPKIEKQLKLKILVKRTALIPEPQKFIHYLINTITIDKPELLKDLTSFFADQAIPIVSIIKDTFINSNGVVLCNLDLIIKLNTEQHIPTLREKFSTYCDNINLDAALEPLRD